MESFFAENLIKARKHYGWTQQQAADKINIKRSRYASYEEARAEPGYKILNDIFSIFRIADTAAFFESEKFDITKQNGSPVMKQSILEKQYAKLSGKDKIAVDVLLEI